MVDHAGFEFYGKEYFGTVDAEFEDFGIAVLRQVQIPLCRGAIACGLCGDIPFFSVERYAAQQTVCGFLSGAARVVAVPFQGQVGSQFLQFVNDEAPALFLRRTGFVVLLRAVDFGAKNHPAVNPAQHEIGVGTAETHFGDTNLEPVLTEFAAEFGRVAQEFVFAADAVIMTRPALERTGGVAVESRFLEERGVEVVVVLIPGGAFQDVGIGIR